MKLLFVDTGAFIARALASDSLHKEAAAQWSLLATSATKLVSTEHVFDETLTLLARRAGYPYASDWADRHLASHRLEWVCTTTADLQSATQLMRKFADQSISFTDCVSFVVMKTRGIRDVFGFDRHFTAAGFRLLQARKPRLT